MTAEVISYYDATAIFERDRKAFRLRLAGVSNRRIAEELKCSLDDVDHALARMCGAVSPDFRTRTVRLELERLDDLQRAHYAKAAEGDVEHTAIILRIMERRGRLLGLDAPPSTEDALRAALAADHQTSTERMRAAIDFVCSQRGPVIESTANEIKETDGGPVPPGSSRDA